MFIKTAAKVTTTKIRFALEDGRKANEMEWQVNERIEKILESLIQESIAKTFLHSDEMRNEIIERMPKS